MAFINTTNNKNDIKIEPGIYVKSYSYRITKYDDVHNISLLFLWLKHLLINALMRLCMCVRVRMSISVYKMVVL